MVTNKRKRAGAEVVEAGAEVNEFLKHVIFSLKPYLNSHTLGVLCSFLVGCELEIKCGTTVVESQHSVAHWYLPKLYMCNRCEQIRLIEKCEQSGLITPQKNNTRKNKIVVRLGEDEVVVVDI